MAFDITGQLNLRLASGAVRQIANEINSGLRASGVGAVNVPVRADVNAIRSVVSEIGQATNAVERFAQQSGLAFKRFTAFSVAAVPFIQVASGIRSAISEAVEFDKQMVRLRQVAVGAGSEVSAIGKEVSRLSISLGISSQDLIKTAVTLKQANLSINETRDALEALAKSALAPNFDSIEQTVEGAIAVMNQFKIKSKDMEAALGSMNAVAGEFAVEASDLIEVVRRAGGAFAATGGSLNELLGLFTSVRQTTRESAESIATGLRTIFTRIQRNDTVDSLKQIGVNLRYTRQEASKIGDIGLEDQFVGAYEAVRRLSAALTQLPQADPRYSAIVENLGGYRQISKVIPLIQEFAVSERALMVAEAGRVSLTVNAAQAADSYANRLTRLKESYLEFGRSLMNTQGFKLTFSAFEEIARGILSVTNALQPLMPLITAFAAVRIGSNLGSFFSNFGRGASYAGAGHLLGRASGGIVPGVGDSDSVPMALQPGSFVVRKSSVKKAGASNLARMASGAVPTMLTPGEYVFSPSEARKIGLSRLKHLNASGMVPGFNDGGEITDDDLRRLITRAASKKGITASDDQIEKLLGVVKKSIPHETMMERVRSNIAATLGGDSGIPYGLEKDLKSLNKRGLKEIARSMSIKTPASDVDAIRQIILEETTKPRPPIELAKRKAGLYGVRNSFDQALSGEMQGELSSTELLRAVKKNFVQSWEQLEFNRTGNKVKFPNSKSKFWDDAEELSSMRHYDGIKDSMMRDPETKAFFEGKSLRDADRDLFGVINPRNQATKIDRQEIYKRSLEAAVRWDKSTSDPIQQAIDKHVQADPFSENELNIGNPSNYLVRQTTSKEQRQAMIKQRAEARKAEKEAKAADKKAIQEEAKKARAEARAEARKRKLEEQELIKQQIRDENEEEISTGIILDKPNRGILGETLGRKLPPVSARRLQFAEVASLEDKTRMLENSFAQRTGEVDLNDLGSVQMRRLAEKLKKQSLLSQEQYDEIADLASTPGFDGKAPPALVAAMQAKEKAMEQQNEQAEKTVKELKEAKKTRASKKVDVGATERFVQSLPINTPSATDTSLTPVEAVAAGGGGKKPPAKPPAPPASSEPPGGGEEPPRRSLPTTQGEMLDVAESILPNDLSLNLHDYVNQVQKVVNEKDRKKFLTQAQIDNIAYRPGAGPVNFKEEEDYFNYNKKRPERKLPLVMKDDNFKLNLSEDILPSLESMIEEGLRGTHIISTIKAKRYRSKYNLLDNNDVVETDRGKTQNNPLTIPRQGFHGGYVPPVDHVNNLVDDPFNPKRTFGEGLAEYKNSQEYAVKKAEKDLLASRLSGMAFNKDKLGAVTSTVSTIDSSKIASFLAEMSNQKSGPFATTSILVDHLAKTLERTRPEMSDGARNKLARSKATDIFRTARKATGYENMAEEAEFRQKQAQERADNIRLLPQLVEQANLLRDRAKSDPIVQKEYNRILSELRRVATTVSVAEGVDKEKLVGKENGQIKLSTVYQDNLQKSAAENDVLAKNAAKQAAEAREKAATAAKSLEGMGASVSRDASGNEAVRFSGPASLFGVDADKSRGATDDTLARVLEKRIEDRLFKLDPGGKGIGDATKEAIQQEEVSRLHKEYVEGRRHQIAAEHHLTDMTIATATASEEFAHAMENGTRVVEQQSATGKTVVNKNPYDRGIVGEARRGSYEELINQRLQDEIDRVSPNGATLPKQTIDRLRSTVTDRTNEELLGSLNTHVRSEHGITDRLVAQEMAHQRLTEIIKENGNVRLRSNRAIAAETAEFGRSGGLAKFSNLLSSAGEKFKTLFTSDTGFFALQAGASFIGDAISRRAGSADVAAESGREENFVGSRSLGSAFSGAGVGASVMQGAGFGPLGMAVGAASGAVMMFATSLKDASNELSQSKIAISQKQANDALSNFAKGTANLNPELIRSKQNTIDTEMSSVAQRNASIFGFGLLYSNEGFNAELDKQRRESAATSVPSQMDALTKIIEDQAKNSIGNNNAKNDAELLQLFRDSLYKMDQGIGATLLGKISAGTQQDFSLLEKKLFDSFKRIRENEQTRNMQLRTESNVNNSAATFGNFGSAIATATQRLQNMAVSTKNITDIMDGTVSLTTGQGLVDSVQRPFAADNGEFINAVKSITSMAGAAGGDVEKSASVVAAAGRVLPGIINAVRSQPALSMATGTNFSIQVSDMLRQTLESQKLDPSQISSVTQMIQGQLAEEDFTKILRETGQDMGKLIQKLLGPISEPLKQSFTDIAKNLNERSKIFADGLSDLANRMRVSGELIDKVNSAEAASIRNRITSGVRKGLVSEDAADMSMIQMGAGLQQAKLSRLTGFGGAGAQNPQFIASALGGVLDDIRNAEERVSRASKGGNVAEQNSASVQLVSLKTRAADLGQALKNLTDVSERTSQAQEKLSKIQSDREGRQALGIRYATANTEGRAEIAGSFRLLEAAARMGTASSFSVRQQNQIFSLLSSLSPQMKLAGLGNVSVKDVTSQLLKTTFGGAFDLDPQTAALERALDNFVQNNYDIATQAARAQAEIQQKLQADFFSNLQSNQQAFLESMANLMDQNAKNAAMTQQLMAANRVQELEKNIGDASIIGKLGISTDAQFAAFKGSLKNPEMSKLMEASTRIAEGEKSMRRITEGSDRFAGNLVNSVGNRNVGDTMGAAAGIIKTQLEELGIINQEDKNNVLVAMDRFFRVNRVNGNFGTEQDQVKKALISAAESVLGERVGAAHEDMNKAQNNLARSTEGKLSAKVFENLANEIQRSSNTLNITTIEKSIAAVDGMNVSFTKMNDMLTEARIKLDQFTKIVEGIDARPAGRANGGLVRFFNKGGWGHQGSTTPHSSDTVNARINPNEFVVSAGPAQRNKKLLENINAGYANGGLVAETEEILNPNKTLEAEQQAKRVARINAESMFLMRIKDMKPQDRAKFIEREANQIRAIAGKETEEQLGLRDIINKLMLIEKQRMDIAQGTNLEGFHAARRKMGIAEALRTLPKKIETGVPMIYREAQKIMSEGKASSQLSSFVDKHFKDNAGTSLIDLLKNEPDLSSHAYLTDIEAMAAYLNGWKRLSLFEDFGTKREEFHTFGRDFSSSTKAIDSFISAGILLDIPEGDTAPKIKMLEQSEIDKEILSKYYPPGILNKVYSESMSELSDTTVQDFVADIKTWAQKSSNTKKLGLDYNYEKIISDLIQKSGVEAQGLQQEKQKLASIRDTVNQTKKSRMGSMQTADSGISKIFDERNNAQFGPKQDADLMRLQLMAMEADAFNKLNPAVQTKLLELKRRRILENKLTPAEQAQMAAMGLDKLINSTEDLTGDEIRQYASDRSKMTLIQRAALDVLMGKIAAQSQGKIKEDPDSLSPAEKIAYLMSVDAEGRSAALNDVADRKNAVLFNRIGMWITSNPGAISGMLKKSEDKGPFGYARDVSLLEILSSAYGSPTSLPKASDVFKNRTLKSKEQIEAGEKAKEAVLSHKESFEAGMRAALGPAADGLIGAAQFGGRLLGFASGGLVPGVGNTDSVRANLPVGSYVIRKSSVQKFGAENLAALPHMAKGGVVPAMVMPGEHIFTPQEASKIGISKLDTINKYGGGSPGGVKPNAKAFWNGEEYDVVHENGRAILVPKNGQRWSGNRNMQQLGFQPQTLSNAPNPLANNANVNANQMNEQQFLAMEAVNQMIGGNGGITGAKAKYFSLRDELRNPRNRTKEKIAEFRQLYGILTNPLVAQMDAQRQMMGAQDAFASFQQDPRAFIAKSREMRALAANTKASMEERVAAKEQLNQMNYAARFIDPRALSAAARTQRNATANVNNDPLQGGLLRLNPALKDFKSLQAPNPKPAPVQGWTPDDDIREARLAKQPKPERGPWKPFDAIFKKAEDSVAQHKASVEAEGQARYNQYYQESRDRLQKEGKERQALNPKMVNAMRALSQSPYIDQKEKDAIIKQYGFKAGGLVPGIGSGDTVPALLEPGELVVPKKQVQKFANGGMVGGIQGFANGGMAQGGPELLDVAARFNQAATQISQGLSGFSTSVSTFNGAVANFGTFVDKFDEAVGKIPGQIELSGANEISVNLMGQDSIVKAVTEAIGPMIAQAIRDSQPVEQRAQ